jgi:hypothetical protein
VDCCQAGRVAAAAAAQELAHVAALILAQYLQIDPEDLLLAADLCGTGAAGVLAA